MVSRAKSLDGSDRRNLIAKAEEVARALERLSIKVKATSEISLAKLQFISDAEEAQAFEGCKAMLNGVNRYGGLPTKEAVSLALKDQNLKAPALEWDESDKRDFIVEMFSADHRVFWASINLWRHVHYDILTMLLFPWFELYERDQNITKAFFANCARLMTGEMDLYPAKTTSQCRLALKFQGLKFDPILFDITNVDASILVREDSGERIGFISRSVVEQTRHETGTIPFSRG